MTFATIGSPSDKGGAERYYILLALSLFPQAFRQRYRAFHHGKLGSLFPMQLACAEVAYPDYTQSRECQSRINRMLQKIGFAPSDVDYRKTQHQLLDFIAEARPALEQVFYHHDIPIDPTLLVAGTELEFVVLGYQTQIPHEQSTSRFTLHGFTDLNGVGYTL